MIKVVKFITGEEVVGDIEYNEDIAYITRPCAVMLISSKSSPDQHSMALIPYAAYTNGHQLKIKTSSIIWEADLQEDVFEQYKLLFAEGVQVFSSKTPSTASLNIVSN